LSLGSGWQMLWNFASSVFDSLYTLVRSLLNRCSCASRRSLALQAYLLIGPDTALAENKKSGAPFGHTDWPTRTEAAQNLLFFSRRRRRFPPYPDRRFVIMRWREVVVSSPGWLKTALVLSLGVAIHTWISSVLA
jgi:hypothetical protein